MLIMTKCIFTQEMIRSWQHSEKCRTNPRTDTCICGLAALQGAQVPEPFFYLETRPLDPEHS